MLSFSVLPGQKLLHLLNKFKNLLLFGGNGKKNLLRLGRITAACRPNSLSSRSLTATWLPVSPKRMPLGKMIPAVPPGRRPRRAWVRKRTYLSPFSMRSERLAPPREPYLFEMSGRLFSVIPTIPQIIQHQGYGSVFLAGAGESNGAGAAVIVFPRSGREPFLPEGLNDLKGR